MTIGEARISETDAIMFASDINQENRLSEANTEELGEVKFVEGTNKFDIKDRFARLKKSLRKRSVSIL